MIFAVPALAATAGPGTGQQNINKAPPPVTSAVVLPDRVDWSAYVQPPDLAGFLVRYGTTAGTSWTAALPVGGTEVVRPNTYVLLSELPSTAVEVLIVPVDNGGLQGLPAYRQSVTGVSTGGGEWPPAPNLVYVATPSSLAGIIPKLKPGNHVVLSGTGYPAITVPSTVQGTPDAPIVFRAGTSVGNAVTDVNLSATIAGDFTANGPFVGVKGCKINGTAFLAAQGGHLFRVSVDTPPLTQNGIQVTQPDCVIEKTEVRNYANAAISINGNGLRLSVKDVGLYNHVSGGVPLGGAGIMIGTSAADDTTSMRCVVDGLLIVGYPGSDAIECKSDDNTIGRFTILGVSGGRSSANVRHGERNVFKSGWVEYGDVMAADYDTAIVMCKTTNGSAIAKAGTGTIETIKAGGIGAGNYLPAARTRIIKHDGAIIVGYANNNVETIDPTLTSVEECAATPTKGAYPSPAVNNATWTILGKTTYSPIPPPPVKLTTNDVGPGPAGTVSTGGGNYPSGLPWLSGWNPIGDATVSSVSGDANLLGGWRGRKTDLFNVKCAGRRSGATMSEMVGSISSSSRGSLYAAAYQAGIRISQVVLPITSDGTFTNAKAASGWRDGAGNTALDYHRQIANWLKAQNRRAPFIIRLGHEMEAAANPYSPQNGTVADYVKMMQDQCDVYHSIVGRPPDVYIDWCHLKALGFAPWSGWYPGDNYIDCIGMDVYWTESNATSYGDTPADYARWMDNMKGPDEPGGIRSLAQWAISRGKVWGIGEWSQSNPIRQDGNFPTGGPGSQYDRPNFISAMWGMFTTYKNSCLYESLFNAMDDPKDQRLIIPSGSGVVSNPWNRDGAARYKQLWTP